MADRVIFVCTIVIAAVYFYATTLIPTLEIGDPLGPKAFPRLLGVCLLIAAGLFFLEMWKDRKAPVAKRAHTESRDWRHLRVIAGVTAWTGAYYAAFEKLGYVVATTIFLLGLMAWFHRGKWISNVLTSALFAVLSYIMFLKLEVRLPQGILPF
jgi:putative tricarboxylic transport membrane protein